MQTAFVLEKSSLSDSQTIKRQLEERVDFVLLQCYSTNLYLGHQGWVLQFQAKTVSVSSPNSIGLLNFPFSYYSSPSHQVSSDMPSFDLAVTQSGHCTKIALQSSASLGPCFTVVSFHKHLSIFCLLVSACLFLTSCQFLDFTFCLLCLDSLPACWFPVSSEHKLQILLE